MRTGGAYTFNGVSPNDKPTTEEVDKEAIRLVMEQFPDPRDRQIVSKIMNQRMPGNFGEIAQLGMSPDAPDIEFTSVPGFDNMARYLVDGQNKTSGDTREYWTTYDIRTNENGTATITIKSPLAIDFPYDAQDAKGNTTFGIVVHTATVTVKLSSGEQGPSVVNSVIGQQVYTSEQAAQQLPRFELPS